MSGPAKYFIVEADSMPEIFRKVAEAKRLGIGKEELEALIARGFAQQEKEDL